MAKHLLSVCRTIVHPLGTVVKNEAVTIELRNGLLDFVIDFPKVPTIALNSTLTSICSACALTFRQCLIDDGLFILS